MLSRACQPVKYPILNRFLPNLIFTFCGKSWCLTGVDGDVYIITGKLYKNYDYRAL